MDIVVWLRSLGLGKYEAAFRENEIDETVLPSMTHENLKELGVSSFGHRVKLLDAIAVGQASSKTPSVDEATSSSTRSAHCKHYPPMPEQHANVLEVLISQMAECRCTNAIFSKPLGVLGHAELFEPLLYLLHCARLRRYSPPKLLALHGARLNNIATGKHRRACPKSTFLSPCRLEQRARSTARTFGERAANVLHRAGSAAMRAAIRKHAEASPLARWFQFH